MKRDIQKRLQVLIFLTLITLLFSCSKTFIVPKEILNERITNEKLSHHETVSLLNILTVPIGVVVTEGEEGRSRFSNLEWLPVIDEDGKYLEVEINAQSTFVITTKDGQTVKMIAKSAFIENGILKGKRSIILGMAREVKIDEIEGIELYTEGSKTRTLQNNQK